MDAYQKADRELKAETSRQVDMILASSAIALKRYWGWGAKRIKAIFDETYKVWEECADSQASMLQMLYEETEIEMRREGSDSDWRNLMYLNGQLKKKRLNRAQMIYMRQQQKKWMGCIVEAGLFLALNRKEGFGFERIGRLRNQIEDVRWEFDKDIHKLIVACKEETGLILAEGKVKEDRCA